MTVECHLQTKITLVVFTYQTEIVEHDILIEEIIMAIWIIALTVKKKIMDNNIITVAIALVTSITSFIFGQHKAKREIESMTITNVQKSVDVYREIIEDLRGEVSELLIKVNQLEDKIDELHSENSQLRKMLKEYKTK